MRFQVITQCPHCTCDNEVAVTTNGNIGEDDYVVKCIVCTTHFLMVATFSLAIASKKILVPLSKKVKV